MRKPDQELTILAGQPALEIANFDLMEPFLMSLVSDSDLWMYISSLGSLTAGRIDEDHSVFPYCPEDMIHRTAGKTGACTVFRVWSADGSFTIWEPLAGLSAGEGCRRNLYKSVLGNFIVFEEIHKTLGLTFRYRWSACDEFGFVRTSEIVNFGGASVRVDFVDGVLNLIPAGITYGFLQRMSVLPDAYTECDVDAETGLATISLASLIVDKPEPGEALMASVVWSRGLEDAKILLSIDQLVDFRAGTVPCAEELMRGRRGNYLVTSSIELAPDGMKRWDIVVDGYRTQGQVESLRAKLMSGDPESELTECLIKGTERLQSFISAADGQSCSADLPSDAHHEACVLFNVMRGGTFAFGDKVLVSDFRQFVGMRNKAVAKQHESWIDGLGEMLPYEDLIQLAGERNDSDLLRVTYEYLPLTFSRRHGDPSRPWNRFSIRLKNPDGTPLLAYEGNWRDIFQNWEALCLSYPMFIESVIAKFVNASTVDGYNPYRIMREGVDWEVPDPDDAWSSIGYWGDHQIIYLLKFLELANEVRPEGLRELLAKKIFSYANVPLRLRDYSAMLENPHSTIDFDFSLNRDIFQMLGEFGTDAKLVSDGDRNVFHATLAEKLLVPALSKLGNLVVDAGIWMNTQRPEWNDANNALVGNGVSMVTLSYLRRYLSFCQGLFQGGASSFIISSAVAEWLRRTADTLESQIAILDSNTVSDEDRRRLLDALGQIFADYRKVAYSTGPGAEVSVSAKEIMRLFQVALPYLDHSIRASRREDGLYHAYNLLDVREDGVAQVSHLYEMLEGQVAVISAGILAPSEVSALVDAMFESKIYRSDQNTFMLYPERKLPGFLAKNIVPESLVLGNPLLKCLIESGDGRVLMKDVAGHYRFAAGFQNASFLKSTLTELELEPIWSKLVREFGKQTLDDYETVFCHRFFTGRSGSMYGYEGLGSIYWHMVSKLMVAVQEAFLSAERLGAPAEELAAIAEGYYRIRAGMGFNKSAHQFGAFPSDPYSHTPAKRGAKQPGMTGQSKEDILTRWMEFGVSFQGGLVCFHPSLLRRGQFLKEPRVWSVRDLSGNKLVIELPANSIGFTVCGIPVVYHLGGEGAKTSAQTSGGELTFEGTCFGVEVSRKIMSRSGEVTRIDVWLAANEVLTA